MTTKVTVFNHGPETLLVWEQFPNTKMEVPVTQFPIIAGGSFDLVVHSGQYLQVEELKEAGELRRKLKRRKHDSNYIDKDAVAVEATPKA